jgi:hypothetical protein
MRSAFNRLFVSLSSFISQLNHAQQEESQSSRQYGAPGTGQNVLGERILNSPADNYQYGINQHQGNKNQCGLHKLVFHDNLHLD